jgi:phytoene dehydrogenase-like protein
VTEARGARYDAAVVGSGPNGLAAAITLAEAGRRVVVLEAADEPGGGLRSAPLTNAGFLHDVCSAVHPLALGSPFFRSLDLGRHGLAFLHPPLPLAHPFDDGTAAALHTSLAGTAAALGRDAAAYHAWLAPLVRDWRPLVDLVLQPLRPRPVAPLLAARFGARALPSASATARGLFRGRDARALVAGLAAHAILPLERAGTSAFALVLATLAHAVGWPVPRGGSRSLAAALLAELAERGGSVRTGQDVATLADVPTEGEVVLCLSPRATLAVAGERFGEGYRRALAGYRYGPGVFKLDLALDGPVPWRAGACRLAGTVHVGGTFEEIAAAERAVWAGEHPAHPFVIAAQPSLVDPTRARAGRHVLWAYCHVPHGSTRDMTEPLLAQLERFAPGLRERIVGLHALTAEGFERHDPNYVGGDINVGVQDLRGQLFRPVARWDPYATPDARIALGSSATPPGGGVHGMAGWGAARSLLRRAEHRRGRESRMR